MPDDVGCSRIPMLCALVHQRTGILRIVWTIGGEYGVIAEGLAESLYNRWLHNRCVTVSGR